VVKQSSEIRYEAPACIARGAVVTNPGGKQGLKRLAMDPKNANALMALYENHEVEIRAAAIRWFGNNRDLCEQCIHNILVAIGRNAGTYDPQSTDAGEWVRNCADTEARRLREALDAAGSRGKRARRAI
jgi:DNA-directed RNA polymerase specialized sigma24 family protein